MSFRRSQVAQGLSDHRQGNVNLAAAHWSSGERRQRYDMIVSSPSYRVRIGS